MTFLIAVVRSPKRYSVSIRSSGFTSLSPLALYLRVETQTREPDQRTTTWYPVVILLVVILATAEVLSAEVLSAAVPRGNQQACYPTVSKPRTPLQVSILFGSEHPSKSVMHAEKATKAHRGRIPSVR